MKWLIALFVVATLAGCSSVPQEELDAKIQKCTDAGMLFTYMNDFRGKPIDVTCVRRHDNEK